jgi:hypothetical protein
MTTIDSRHEVLIEKNSKNVSRQSLFNNVRLLDRRFHLLAWRVIAVNGKKVAVLKSL